MTTRLPKIVTVCNICKASIVFLEGQEAKKCRYCHTVNERPQTKRDVSGIYGQLKNADDYLYAGDFDSAEVLYDYVICHQPEESRAYWGKLLCKYGVEYVGDGPKKIIVCHFTRNKSLIEELEYAKACKFADEETRSYYKTEAERINAVQIEIRRRSEREKPFDIFLCYKQTDPDSDSGNAPTKDSERMSDLYDDLTKRGYRVFCADRTLRGKDISSEMYEAIIYHAIHTAKIMIVFASKAYYLNTLWVKSEWTRYLERFNHSSDKGAKRIIPLYEGITVEDFPVELRAYEAETWSSLLGLINKIEYWIPLKDPEKEQRYKLAKEFMIKNKFLIAAGIFESLEQYNDSSLMATVCRAAAEKEEYREKKEVEKTEEEKAEAERRSKQDDQKTADEVSRLIRKELIIENTTECKKTIKEAHEAKEDNLPDGPSKWYKYKKEKSGMWKFPVPTLEEAMQKGIEWEPVYIWNVDGSIDHFLSKEEIAKYFKEEVERTSVNVEHVVEQKTSVQELCNTKEKNDEFKADEVVKKIDEIKDSVNIKESIESARIAYDALTTHQKELVKNANLLHSAEEEYELSARAVKSKKNEIENAIEKEEQQYRRVSQGLCRHCGGTFKKGWGGIKCTSCHKIKDYNDDYSVPRYYKAVMDVSPIQRDIDELAATNVVQLIKRLDGSYRVKDVDNAKNEYEKLTANAKLYVINKYDLDTIINSVAFEKRKKREKLLEERARLINEIDQTKRELKEYGIDVE